MIDLEQASELVTSRRAIEALRAGVPNRDAVISLGTAHGDIEQRFREQLNQAKEAGTAGLNPSGFLVAGNFGSGKSHLLEYLKQLALTENFVVSKVVVSKETPLYDPAKLFRAAISSAIVPRRRGAALAEVAAQLDPDSRAYRDFYEWITGPECDLSQRFAATVFLHQRAREQDLEVVERILSFWAGDQFDATAVKNALKELGQRVAFRFEKANSASLALQRFRFAPRLMMAAGYNGWVLLVDEVELIGRYSVKHRGKSYAAVARWSGNLKGEGYPGLTSVLAITTDFERAVIDEKNDRIVAPAKLRTSARETDQLTASQAEKGMQIIGKAVKLAMPSPVIVAATYDRVRALHAAAYGWQPPGIDAGERLASTRMREYVKRWIYQWDLKRLYPDYRPDIEIDRLEPSYAEDEDLELPLEGDLADPRLDAEDQPRF